MTYRGNGIGTNMPTDYEVRILMALNVQAGDYVSYSKVTEVTGIEYNNRRFTTVISSWAKKLLREHHLEIKRAGGKDGGINIMTADERVDEGVGRTRKIAKAAARNSLKVELINGAEVSDEKKPRHLLLRRHAAALRDAAGEAFRSIVPPSVKKDIPFRQLGESRSVDSGVIS